MHPRFLYFPWQADYSAQPNIFCPYVMSVGQPSYRSRALNIDELGFRYQYDAAGQRIDLATAKQRYRDCSLLLGNSTGFGVSLKTDDGTLGHYLGSAASPCINLSVRGATMQQELAVFQTFKHLLPSVKQIILLTGVCDVSLAIQPEDIYSPLVGAINGKNVYHRQYLSEVEGRNDLESQARRNFLAWAEKRYTRSGLLQGWFERQVVPPAPAEPSPTMTKELFETNLRSLMALVDNVMETWGWIRHAAGIDVQVVLQPILGWTDKPRTFIENACVEADLERFPAIALYTNRDAYRKVVAHYEEKCSKHGLTFHDANTYFDTLTKKDGTLFSDLCHLTDQGTALLAGWLRSTWYDRQSDSK